MSRELLVNRRLNPRLETLPAKFTTIYPNQVAAVQQVMEAFGSGAKAVVLDAPTGTGKTVLGEIVRRMVRAEKTAYICHSKALQDQFLADFDYAKIIKGRANYPTIYYPEKFRGGDAWNADQVSCDDCTATMENPICEFCPSRNVCPYQIAKRSAIASELCVANSSYFLSECNGPGKLRGRDLVIADEADTLEQALMGHVSVEISRRRMEKFGWSPPAKSTVPSSWEEWLNEHVPMVGKMAAEARGKAGRLAGRAGLPASRGAIGAAREVRYLEGLYEGLRLVQYGMAAGEPWVYTGEGSSRDKTPGPKAVSFKPSRVDAVAKKMLWDYGKRWLLMSATVISADEMMASLGWKDEFRVVRVPSTFPIENRRIYPVMVAPMSRKTMDEAKVKMGRALVKICERHPNDRVLVHCVSYSLADYLAGVVVGSGRQAITHVNSAAKEEALFSYAQSSNAVLLSPSMDRGVDLPGDLCRVQVICKVPFPNLGDKQVSSRMHSPGGQTWYNVQTVRSIVQMTGRAVRSPTDYAATYILDAQFQSMIWSRSRGLLPSWWTVAVDWREGEAIRQQILR